MGQGPDLVTEGRLIALRQALAMVIAGKDRASIATALAETVHDGQEDPGAVEMEAFALEAAVADERRAIAREIRLRAGE